MAFHSSILKSSFLIIPVCVYVPSFTVDRTLDELADVDASELPDLDALPVWSVRIFVPHSFIKNRHVKLIFLALGRSLF